MSKKDRNKTVLQSVIMILLVINLILSAFIIYHVMKEERETYQTTQKYTLYIGLNDKDTYQQKTSKDDARKIVNEICARHTDGYTSFDAEGGWTDQNNVLTKEETLVYMFNDIDEDDLDKIMDEVLDALNQNTILVEKDQTTYSYYSGNHNENKQTALQH